MITYSPPSTTHETHQESVRPSSASFFHYVRHPQTLPFRVVENFNPQAPIQQLAESMSELAALRQRPQGWNGYDVAAPDSAAIARSEQWLPRFQRQVARNSWRKPHVTSSATGEVVLEWWNGKKTLTLYIGSSSVEYLKAWGQNLETEMDEGVVSDENVASLWRWFIA